MQITQDEILLMFREWEARYKPVTLLDCEHNRNLIASAVRNRVIAGAPLSAEKIRDIVDDFLKYDQSNGVRGRLETVNAASAAAPVDEAAPHLDEPMLRNLTSMSAVAELTAAQVKMFCTPAAMHEYDNKGRKVVSLNQKFNERVAWLKAHPDVVLNLSEPQPQQTVVVHKRVEDPRITAIREQIAVESKGYTDYAHKKGERLNKTLNELLRDPSRQTYRDRSRGGIEVINGLDAVERIMRDVIRDYDSPFK